jgi:hypothetical protein
VQGRSCPDEKLMPGSSRAGIVAALLAALGGGWYLRERSGVPATEGHVAASTHQATDDPAQAAFESRARGKVIRVMGVIERILADDRDGSPHQRFIIRTAGGTSLLIAHNLDLAPRLEGLREGESVTVLGEYEWNEKGGVMHWTHDDPQGQHVAGYIEWLGRRYQ